MEGSLHTSQHPAVQSISHLCTAADSAAGRYKLNNDTVVPPTPASAKLFLLHVPPLEMYGNQIILRSSRLLSYRMEIQKLLQGG